MRRYLIGLFLSSVIGCSALAARPNTESFTGATENPTSSFDFSESGRVAFQATRPEIVLAQATGKKFQVLVSSGMEKTGATSLQRSLQQDGYGPVEMQLKDGKYAIVIGGYPNEKDAQQLLSDLKGQGYSPEKVISADSATPAQGDKTVSSAPKGMVYRILIKSLNTKDEAEVAKQSLIDDKYSKVDVVQDGSKFNVYVAVLPNEDEAKKYQDTLKGDGYSGAQVVQVADTADDRATEAVAASDIVIPKDLASKLTAAQQEEAKKLISAKSKVEGGSATAREIDDLRKQMRDLNNQVVSVVNIVSEGELQKRDKRKKLTELYRQFDEKLLAKDFEAARGLITKMREVDPDEPMIEFKTDRLGRTEQMVTQGKEQTQGGAKNAQDTLKLSQLINEAKSLEAQRRYTEARDRYYSVLQMDPNNTEAKDKTVEMTRNIERGNQPGSGPVVGPMNKYVIGIVVGAALLVVILLLMFMRRERQLIRKVEDLATQAVEARSTSGFGPPILQQPVEPLRPSTAAGKKTKAGKKGKDSQETPALGGASLFGGSMLGSASMDFDEGKEEEQIAQEASAEVPALGEQEHRVQAGATGEPDMVFLGGLDVSSPPADVLSPPPSVDSDSVDLSDLGLGSPNFMESTPTSVMPPPSMDLNLDELLKQPFPGAREAEDVPMARIEDISPAIPMQVQQTTGLSETIASAGVAMGGSAPASFEIPTPPGVSAVAPPPSKPAAPASAPAGPFYSESFEGEAAGKQPKGWQGDYDYATLTVDDKMAPPGSKHCIRFEKRSGAGSANYVCKFPNASGHVVVEFDMRCDDKNKYLLGFYIEKDEDFKQSVHTIVHRTDSKSQPSLRIQGEPIPYELGTWRHIKYDLQLLTGHVNAYVDSQHVVKDAKLPTTPAYINTLSIRDNLATTGVLYLGNIQIRKG